MAGKGDKWRDTNWTNYWESDYWKERENVAKRNKKTNEEKKETETQVDINPETESNCSQ